MSPSSRCTHVASANAGGVVASPALHLHGLAALGEQQGRAGVPERAEARPRRSRLLSRRLEHVPAEIVRREHGPGGGREHGIRVARPFALLPVISHGLHERVADGDLAPAVPTLGQPQLAADDPLADLDMRARSVQLDVTPLERDRL